jgi:murein DD-endopeptidase MepM/ murein hydrolase activator NlpD
VNRVPSLVTAENALKALVQIQVLPERPLIEHRGAERLLNFDFLLKNTGATPLHLNRIEISVYEDSGKLAWQRELDENGHPSGMSTIEDRDLKADSAIAVFNPFYEFDPDLPLVQLVYRFFFNAVGYETATPLDFQSYAEINVHPQDYPGKTDLILPVRQRSLIFDVHDFYAHHRRQSPANPVFQKLGMRGNPVRYAYDFCPVNDSGPAHTGDNPCKKENWYAYGAAIVAPGAGIVRAAINDTPENDYKDKRVIYTPIPDEEIQRSLGGNYVVIDHGNGEFSYFAPMRPGSVRVKQGDRVQQGQQIGEIGFAGDAFIPHLHYMLIDNPDILKAESLPSYFRDFHRVVGSTTIVVKHGQIDSGDIVEPKNE